MFGEANLTNNQVHNYVNLISYIQYNNLSINLLLVIE